jgi:urease accessory protein
MTGHLHLVFAEREGRTFISEQSFRAPMHVSKPYWDGQYLIVNVVNPTAGLFAGDLVDVSQEAAAGSRTIVTSPSASRLYQARTDGHPIRIEQQVHVKKGAWLDLIPELLIPHAGAKYAQQTHISMEPGGELFFIESMAPGRVAAGESFAFESLRWTTRLMLDGRLLALERYRLAPDDGSLHALRLHYPASYHAAGYVVSSRLVVSRELLQRIAALSNAGVMVGASLLAPGALSLRILAGDALSIRRAINDLRTLIYQELGYRSPALRKL